MVGRDIGTVIVPDADLKVYLELSIVEAEPDDDLKRSGDSENAQPFDDVLRALTRRDQLDSARAMAPLIPADDAVVIDSDNVSASDVAGIIVETFCRRVNGTVGRPDENRGTTLIDLVFNRGYLPSGDGSISFTTRSGSGWCHYSRSSFG